MASKGTAAAAEPSSAAGVRAGYIGTQGAAEETKVGTQIAAAFAYSVVVSDKVPKGDKPVMIARSRAPAESSHIISVEYDPTVSKQIQDRCTSLLGEPVCGLSQDSYRCGDCGGPVCESGLRVFRISQS